METLQYLLFSSIEWLCLILLMFAMFKFPLRGYWGQILLTAAIMSFFSHFVFQVIDNREFATLLQPPVLFLFLWQMFRIHIFFAGLMTIYGYLGYLFIQYFILFIMVLIGVPLGSFLPNSFSSYLLQTVTIVSVFAISRIIHKSRIGFSFVPDYEYAPFNLKGINLKLLVLTIFGYICISFTNFFSFSSSFVSFLFMLFVCAVLAMLLYYALRKELSDD